MSDQVQNTSLAESNATLSQALALHTLTVIGVFAASDGPAALLRSSTGQIARVKVGDAAFGRQVIAIGDTEVLLSGWSGQTEALHLPQG